MKGLTKGSFAALAANMRTAAAILEKQKDSDDGSLLTIFDKEAYLAASVKLVSELPPRKIMMFSKVDIVTLLDQSDEFKVLANRLDELDLSNEATLQSLRKVVLRMVTRKLEKEMKFVVSPAVAEEEDMEEEEMVQAVSPSTKQLQPAVMKEAAATESVSVTPRKRQRSETEEEESLLTKTTDEVDITKQQTEDKEESKEDVKRCKTDSEVAALDLLNHLIASGGADRYLCTAFENTWIHTRRARRQQAAAGSNPTQPATNQTLLDALPAMNTPLIHVAVSLTPIVFLGQPIKGKICAIEVNALKVQHRVTYGQWYSVFKKMVLSNKQTEGGQLPSMYNLTDSICCTPCL